MFRLLKGATALSILLPVHFALAARGVAQETTRVDEPVVVAGVVRDRSSNAVRDAVVTIVDLGRSTRTNDAGVFRLELPAAAAGRELVLHVSLGRLAETEVRVVAGTGTTWRDVALDIPVVPLQSVVATAVGVVDRRAQPARIGRVDAVSVVESAPVATMTELLQARVPGLSVTRASGAPGAASQIRTRGVGPLRFPGGPAVYVDGVRVDAGPRESMLVVDPPTSGLDDLSPHDIESVEVLAGPAAAARYGPDAVTGVIAVQTRRAPVGEQPFRQQITAGYGRMEVAVRPPDNWARCTDASVPICEGLAAGTLVSDNPLMREGFYREGRRASIRWSGRGGGANYGFSMGLGLETEDGYLLASGLDRWNGHASVTLVPTERLRVEAGVGRAVSKIEPVLARGYTGLIGLGMLGSPLTVGGPADGWWDTPGEMYVAAESGIEAERTTPTLRLAHTTLPWLTQRLTAGVDLVRESGRQAFPWIEGLPDLNGQFADAKRWSDVYNVDYLATAELPLESADVSDSRLSLGVQYLRESSRRTGTVGTTEPPTGSERLQWTEREIEWRTAGVLAQWDIGYRDRLFARVGARVDWMRLEYRDSVYGGATGSRRWSLASYAKGDPDPVVAPHVGVSYLVSNTSFWAPIAPVVGTLRLHGAWGRARRKHPDLEVQDFDDDILFMLSTISTARPETVNEFELGAEAGLLDDRLGIGITYFHRTTSDIALLIPSSLGLGVGRVGYGEVVDRGFELDLTARLLRGSALSWTVDAMLRTLDNEVESIGSDLIEAASTGGTSPLPGHPAGTFLRPGHPAGAFFERRILEIDTVANVVQLSERQSLGSPVPEVEAAVSTHLTIGRRIRLYGLLDARGGYRVYNRTAFFRDQFMRNSERAARWPELPAEERIRYFGTRLDAPGGPPTDYEPYYQDGSFVRLREVAVTFALPAPWAARLGASGASFTIGGRNLAIWTDYEGGDPEVLHDPASPLDPTDLFTPPQARRWEARLTVRF